MRSALPVLTLLLTLSLAAPAVAGDVILMTNGRKMGNRNAAVPPRMEDFEASDIEVIEENLDEVRYRLKAVADLQAVKSRDVREVFHDPSLTPSDLKAGQKRMDQLDYAGARDSFEKVVKSRSAPPWARDRAAFEIANSYWWEGDLNATVKAMRDFRSQHGRSRLIGAATRVAARASLALGKADDARKEFEQLKSIPGIPEAEALEAEYYIANLDERVGTANPTAPDKALIKRARTAYRDLYNKLQTKPEMARTRGLCVVGIASCDIALGDHSAARPRLEKLIASQKGDARDDLVLAGAYTRLGNVLLAENAQANDPAVYKQAQLHFLRVVTLYGNAEDADDYMAEALFRAGELFSVLRPAKATDDESKEKRKEYLRRARRELSECVKRYGHTAWGQRARAALASLK
jgi:tetratricopeptide (TPR) repeat protein